MSNEKEDKEKNAREYFRITYRPPENPVFECDKNKYIVLDISEAGFRFSPKKGVQFFEKDGVNGQIVLPNKRGILPVKGTIVRVTPSDVAVQLLATSRVPLARIMEEQRILIQKGKL